MPTIKLLPKSSAILRFFIALTSLVAMSGCATLMVSSASSSLSERDRIVRLQIFLDDRDFGPGKIDGEWGYFTEQSRSRYLRVMRLPLDDRWEKNMDLAAAVPSIYTTFVIPEDAKKFVGNLPGEVAEQAKLKSMPYSSLGEYAAERYHTTERLLTQLNPQFPLNTLRPGDSLIVPNVKPFRIEAVPHSAKAPSPPQASSRRILVDTQSRYLEVIEGDRLVALFPITPGSPAHPAPTGQWKIVNVATMPWFRYDEGVLKRGERTDDFYMLPAGPNNPVGVLWMGLSKPGIGIHGTNNPFTIGRAGSHGCIRLANWDAARMPLLVGAGTPVTIR